MELNQKDIDVLQALQEKLLRNENIDNPTSLENMVFINQTISNSLKQLSPAVGKAFVNTHIQMTTSGYQLKLQSDFLKLDNAAIQSFVAIHFVAPQAHAPAPTAAQTQAQQQ